MEVALQRVYLHLASDLDTYQAFYSLPPDDQRSRAGEVRAYANGRLRIVTGPTRRQEIGLHLLDATKAQVDVLDSWMGVEVMYRDGEGLVIWGSLFDLHSSPHPFRQGYELDLTIHSLARTAEV